MKGQEMSRAEDIHELESLLRRELDLRVKHPDLCFVNADYSDERDGYLVTIKYQDQLTATDVVTESNRSKWPIKCERLARSIGIHEPELLSKAQ